MGGEGGDEGDKESGGVAEGEADDGSDKREDDGFEEELGENVAAAGADGFSDADFVGAFGDGNEHDVHDADATDDEGDAGDEGEHAGDDREERAGGVGDFGARHDGEVLFFVFG